VSRYGWVHAKYDYGRHRFSDIPAATFLFILPVAGQLTSIGYSSLFKVKQLTTPDEWRYLIQDHK